MKKIVLFGATGSIGESTLALIRKNKDQYQLVGISGFSQKEKLCSIADEFKVEHVFEPKDAPQRASTILTFIQKCEPDIVLNAVSGFVGLDYTLATIETGVDLALANKESLVVAGEIVMRKVREKGVNILPVDSEHSAIWQCLSSHKGDLETGRPLSDLHKIHLTCSGGPFFGKTDLSDIKLEDALKHPNWDMGNSITIDSATLANKCLEFIEAIHLFGVSREQVEIVIHQQSIVHSMVEWNDGSVIAQLSPPSMELPIAIALNYPERLDVKLPRQDFKNLDLSFRAPDKNIFKTLEVLDYVTENMGVLPVVFNAVNETARNAFLKNQINFTDIFEILEQVVTSFPASEIESLEQIYEVDKKARVLAQDLMDQKKR